MGLTTGRLPNNLSESARSMYEELQQDDLPIQRHHERNVA